MSDQWISTNDILAAVDHYDGAASIGDIAVRVGRSETGIRHHVMVLVERGELVPLGYTSSGARCYGRPEGVTP